MKNNYFLALLLFFSIAISGYSQEPNKQKFARFTSPASLADARQEMVQKFGLDGHSSFEASGMTVTKSGIAYQRFRQKYKGIPVEGGEYVAVTGKNKQVMSVSGELHQPTGLKLSPSISAETALEDVVKSLEIEKPMWENAFTNPLGNYKKPTGELVILTMPDGKVTTYALAWKFDLWWKDDEGQKRENVYWDAHNGWLLFRDPIIKHVGASSHKGVRRSTTNVKENKGSFSLREVQKPNTVEQEIFTHKIFLPGVTGWLLRTH